MARKKTDLAIVNRSFWPQSQVIGEGLFQFAEQAAENHSVCVITQAEGDLAGLLASKGRGKGVQIRACKSYTTSASGVIKRIAEAVFFMFWTFLSLVRAKPANVYVSTNPPVVVPFIVAVYCRLFGARYVYHLQDIHPEAANIVVPVNGLLFKLLQAVDNFTLRHADAIITLSEDMKAYIQKRSGTDRPIHLLENPSFEVTPVPMEQRTKDIVFCGNAGRLQRIPLLMTAIRDYLQQGGKLRFTFAGGGVHAPDVQALANAYEQVDYLGVIPATEAAELVNQHRWALLPIDDDVTKYAFPSKSSGYALSGAGVLAVCGEDTSVARWVEQLEVGVVCPADHGALVKCFFSLEGRGGESFLMSAETREKLQIPYFAEQLFQLAVPASI
ncbi:glycosyltransferase involved in cell wall biosynthesis [Marinobacter nauticus]|uniref:Glycosyltransferase involved in cell wall biosynthesis n=1 Tax=Marinobacter nauticus TaxID=2743 RepID=A0A368XT33_MARNT|nr:glycosyltransferase family 4 protein [Marinobacter nauticus]RCW71123.1 glycosyltransferase involved in cell wall biosynthesis [Marinobacter nauticus]